MKEWKKQFCEHKQVDATKKLNMKLKLFFKKDNTERYMRTETEAKKIKNCGVFFRIKGRKHFWLRTVYFVLFILSRCVGSIFPGVQVGRVNIVSFIILSINLIFFSYLLSKLLFQFFSFKTLTLRNAFPYFFPVCSKISPTNFFASMSILHWIKALSPSRKFV